MSSSQRPHGTSDPRDAFFDVSGLRDLGRLTGRSASIVLAFSALRLILTLATTALLARLVSPAEQGMVALAMPIILMATGLSEFGLAQAVVQQQTISHRVVSALFWVNLGLGLALSGAAALLGPAAANFYGEPRVTIILFTLAPYILLSVLCVHYVAILRRRMQVRTAELCNVSGMIVSSVASIAAALLGAGYWALVVQLLVGQGVSLVLLFLSVRWLPSAPWNSALREARGAIAFGGFLSADRLLNELVNNLQMVVIGRSFGSMEAGLFYRSQAFAQMPQKRIVSPLSGAFIPSLSRLQNDPAGFRAMYARQLSRGNLVMMPVGLLMILAPDALVYVLLGPDWSAAAPILGWLGLLPITALFTNCSTWALVASGQPRVLFLTRLASVVLLLIVLVIASNYSLVTFVAAYTTAQVLLCRPLFALVATRVTPLDGATILRVIAPDLAFILATAGAGVAMRMALSFNSLIEGVLTGLLILAALSLRILRSPTYRMDVAKVFRLR
ncbi:oligosaccharide flippase family protein [Tropicimonas sp. TH_r6]|uniref:oligosaccharide flippase family protein n=1 Tax=Tropicimonas sp. TH_r6 TaxID=3082085 RepID=UPI002954B24B|nr:oligosaccharide flippase family protein [Tropicimonas sp. TH_r6]MDV7145534.1 oligosaccharide flippase family protein [Tropicimonas sp. TH_r6]